MPELTVHVFYFLLFIKFSSNYLSILGCITNRFLRNVWEKLGDTNYNDSDNSKWPVL